MAVTFPYEYVRKDRFGDIYRPLAKISLKSPVTSKRVDIWMIVDTGADYTILPRLFSEKLKISIERDCFKDITSGVGGEQPVYFYKKLLEVKIGRLQRNIPLAFIDSNEVPPLLGRLGFLETFDTEFLKTQVVRFKD